MDITNYYESHRKIEEWRKRLEETRFETFDKREDKSSQTKEDIKNHCRGKYLTSWAGVQIEKTPFDFALYQDLLWELKPATIIELGTYNGGSALWMADVLKVFGIKTHIHSLDIDLRLVPEKISNRTEITFHLGDSNKIEKSFPASMLEDLPHPWMVMEDAHTNVLGVLEHFDKFIVPGDYLIVEDTSPYVPTNIGIGVVPEAKYEPWGMSKLDALKEFMKKHGSKYRVDTRYTDAFGYNATWHWNGVLRRM